MILSKFQLYLWSLSAVYTIPITMSSRYRLEHKYKSEIFLAREAVVLKLRNLGFLVKSFAIWI